MSAEEGAAASADPEISSVTRPPFDVPDFAYLWAKSGRTWWPSVFVPSLAMLEDEGLRGSLLAKRQTLLGRKKGISLVLVRFCADNSFDWIPSDLDHLRPWGGHEQGAAAAANFSDSDHTALVKRTLKNSNATLVAAVKEVLEVTEEMSDADSESEKASLAEPKKGEKRKRSRSSDKEGEDEEEEPGEPSSSSSHDDDDRDADFSAASAAAAEKKPRAPPKKRAKTEPKKKEKKGKSSRKERKERKRKEKKSKKSRKKEEAPPSGGGAKREATGAAAQPKPQREMTSDLATKLSSALKNDQTRVRALVSIATVYKTPPPSVLRDSGLAKVVKAVAKDINPSEVERKKAQAVLEKWRVDMAALTPVS